MPVVPDSLLKNFRFPHQVGVIDHTGLKRITAPPDNGDFMHLNPIISGSVY